jgi:hypothetical protein
MRGQLKICIWNAEPDCAKPNCTELDNAEPNQALHHPVIMHRQKSKQIIIKLNDTLFSFWASSIAWFFNSGTIQMPALFPSSGKQTGNYVDPWDRAFNN